MRAGPLRFLQLALCASAAALTCSLAGCTPTAPPPQPTPPAEQPDTSAEETPTGQPVELDKLEISLEPVARGLEAPLYVTGAGDGSGRLFVVEQGGRIQVVRDGRVTGPFLDVSASITAGGERGLLGLAFAPDYATTGEFFVNYTDRNGDTEVARFVADDPASDTPRLTGPDVVLRIAQPYSNHNGGCLVFEPGTKRMWVGMGDGGAAGDPHGNGQNPGALLGKMLVLDFGKDPSPKPEIVQSGVRNPWRFTFDRKTHDLWIGDVGQGEWEEIDFIELAKADGINWGWNVWEGNHRYSGGSGSREGFRFPITEYSHREGQSVSGGYVYRGERYPALVGTYLYADYEAGWIAGLQRTDASGTVLPEPRVRTLLPEPGIAPSSFGEDDEGELYVCDHGGAIYQITARGE